MAKIHTKYSPKEATIVHRVVIYEWLLAHGPMNNTGKYRRSYSADISAALGINREDADKAILDLWLCGAIGCVPGKLFVALPTKDPASMEHAPGPCFGANKDVTHDCTASGDNVTASKVAQAIGNMIGVADPKPCPYGLQGISPEFATSIVNQTAANTTAPILLVD